MEIDFIDLANYYLLFLLLIISIHLFIIIIIEKNKKKSTIEKREPTEFCSNNLDICIKKSAKGGEFGRGVFANKKFKKGDMIEVGPILAGNYDELFCGLYKDYIWVRNDKDNLPLGYASICNHDDDNNSDINIYDDYYELFAIKDIQKGEEITDNYCINSKEKCMWFESRKIKKV